MMKHNCKKYEKWLYLYREGELKHSQAQQLAEHLKSCAKCAQISRQLGNMQKDMLSWKETSDTDSINTDITANVIGSIRMTEKDSGYLSVTYWDRVLNVFAKPGIQAVSLAVMILFCLTLVFQETSVMLQISNLEKRMALNTAVRNRPVDSQSLDFLVNKPELLTAFGQQTNTNEQYIVIDKSTMEVWMHNYMQTRLQNEILLQFLEKQYPDLYALMAKDSLSLSELDQVLRKHKDILARLKQL